MIGIYKITSPSGKEYIGSSNNIERRWKSYKALRCKGQKAIYSSLVKYGVENHIFEVMFETTEDLLLESEQWFLDVFKPKLNINPIAAKPPNNKGRTLSSEHKQKLSEANKGKSKPPFSAEHRQRLSEARKNTTNETKKKISNSLKKYYKDRW